MALDAATLALTAAELKATLTDAKIAKIFEPTRDELVITLRTRTDTYALLLSARSGSARVCLTEETFENPDTPPSFCMLMRKHLTGGRLLDVHMEPGDRIVYFDFQCTNEMGDLVRNTLCAEQTGCAIVLIGHLNKSSGTQSTYRGLGSIDIMAAVRSLLFIGKVKKDPTTRVLIHEKSSLAPPGETMAFKLGDEEGFRWVGAYEISADDLLDGKEGKPTETKLQRGTKLIYELLADGNTITIREVDEKAKAQGISQRTMREVRSRMKEELDYQMNEKQENTIRLKK